MGSGKLLCVCVIKDVGARVPLRGAADVYRALDVSGGGMEAGRVEDE